MKTKEKVSYNFDPDSLNLSISVNDKSAGGFSGPKAEEQFNRLLDSGAEINITMKKNPNIHGAKVRRLRSLWIKQGIDQHRDAILEPYGVQSTAWLNEAQLDELIARFSAEQHPPVNDTVRRLRSEVLTVLNKLGIYATNGDWTAVNAYLMSNKIAGKLLYQLNADELTVLRTKLNSIVGKEAKKPHFNTSLN